MGNDLEMGNLAEQILSELRCAPEHSRVGEDLVNALVDAMVQANIELETVTLGEVKDLLSFVCRSGSIRRPCLSTASAS